MKPVRFLLPLSTFLLRVGVAFFIFVMYFHHVLDFNFEQVQFYISSLFSIFGVLLVMGVFAKRHTLTVLSALILFLLSLYELFTFTGDWVTINFSAILFMALIALFFLSYGDKNR
jgi:hypothetical protein